MGENALHDESGLHDFRKKKVENTFSQGKSVDASYTLSNP